MIAALILVAAIALAYSNTLRAPFVFDDIAAIRDNPTLRHLWPLSDVLAPPQAEGNTVGGRPVVNLTLALNYAMSGTATWSYHAANLLLHVGAALLVFGVVRRTLRLPILREKFGAVATSLAFAIAGLWALHPLQTEAVTYVVQRAESLAAFFQLLTLYAFIRGAEKLTRAEGMGEPTDAAKPLEGPNAGDWRWLAASVAACFLGAFTKETIVTAPVLVLLYDKTLVGGSWREAWRRRKAYYLLLALSWLPLAGLVLANAGRGGTAGFGVGVSAWAYSLTQYEAITRYLGLAVWPRPLVFDYGTYTALSWSDVAGPALLVWALVGATIFALVRRPVVGLAGGIFFLLLAPSSSVVPVASQVIAEHRMYLPLAAAVALVVLASYAWLGRRSLLVWGAAAVGLGVLTWQRNIVYGSELALWRDTVLHRPGNARAHSNLGNALLDAGRAAEAIPSYQEALRLHPGYSDAENNLGRALVKVGRTAEAVPHYEAALRAKPKSIEVATNLGSALAATGRAREAAGVYERALQLDATAAGPRYNLGNLYFQAGDFARAAETFGEVLRQHPEHNDARFNLAAALVRLNRVNEAVAAYEEILRRSPRDATAHAELANLLEHLNRAPEAIAHYEAALQLQPNFPAARAQLERLRVRVSPATGAMPR